MYEARLRGQLYAVARGVLHVFLHELVDARGHLSGIGHDAVVLKESLLFLSVVVGSQELQSFFVFGHRFSSKS